MYHPASLAARFAMGCDRTFRLWLLFAIKPPASVCRMVYDCVPSATLEATNFHIKPVALNSLNKNENLTTMSTPINSDSDAVTDRSSTTRQP